MLKDMETRLENYIRDLREYKSKEKNVVDVT